MVLNASLRPLALFDALIQKGQLQDDKEQRTTESRRSRRKRRCPPVWQCGLWKDDVYGHLLLGLEEPPILAGAEAPGKKHFHEFLYDIQRLLHQIKSEEKEGMQTGLGVQLAGERIADSVDVPLSRSEEKTWELPC
eukprot:Skav203927  [mRNA]  locus=scaffold228:462055:464389:- [translate_table: standard]